ncbi:MAG: addiction module antidote protein, HigA family [Proteobacteria bacterium]|nr:MAG: addiction module antidote protein, HigA family [Pseudomonadota bacterium]
MGISASKDHVLHPGQILKEIYMKDNDLDLSSLSGLLQCSLDELNEVIEGRGPITKALGIRLAAVLNTSPDLWPRLQSDYDRFIESKKDQLT